jgi:hypothetical protein
LDERRKPMKTQHSPGPWKVRKQPGAPALDVAGPNGEFLAAVKFDDDPRATMRPTRKEAEANAAIMAAGLDLYQIVAELARLILHSLDDLSNDERTTVEMDLVSLGARAHGTMLNLEHGKEV